MTDETGNNDVRDILVNQSKSPLTTMPAVAAPPQSCLRHNESSQQQLVRLVGYRGPGVDTAASWDRLRREQAALQAS